jgi:DNA-binding CsgD family transcriptional regulator
MSKMFRPSRVSERQLECLYWVQEGKSASDIGGILGISSRTVEGHLLRACERLGVKTRIQAVLRARELGLLEPSTLNAVRRTEKIPTAFDLSPVTT